MGSFGQVPLLNWWSILVCTCCTCRWFLFATAILLCAPTVSPSWTAVCQCPNFDLVHGMAVCRNKLACYKLLRDCHFQSVLHPKIPPGFVPRVQLLVVCWSLWRYASVGLYFVVCCRWCCGPCPQLPYLVGQLQQGFPRKPAKCRPLFVYQLDSMR